MLYYYYTDKVMNNKRLNKCDLSDDMTIRSLSLF
jgi:hypothetical protein